MGIFEGGASDPGWVDVPLRNLVGKIGYIAYKHPAGSAGSEKEPYPLPLAPAVGGSPFGFSL